MPRFLQQTRGAAVGDAVIGARDTHEPARHAADLKRVIVLLGLEHRRAPVFGPTNTSDGVSTLPTSDSGLRRQYSSGASQGVTPNQ
jgi:hypothetical protein